MKTLTKLALVSAMAISGHAMAMQSLDDEALSAATGQDGVTISLTGPITMDYLAIVDGDGLGNNNGVQSTEAGAIVIGDKANGGLSITPTNSIDLVIDADGDGTAPVLNIAVDLGDTTISGVDIGVAGTTDAGKTLDEQTSVLNLGDITLNGLTANIQLGNQPQGAMIKLNSTITGGLQISNLALVGTNGEIGLGAVTVTDNASTDLSLALDIDAVADTGLVISGISPMDINASALNLGGGTAANVGSMYISNLNVGTSVTIAGH